MTQLGTELWVPFPPSVNALSRAGRGRVYTSPRYREWKNEATIEAIQIGFKRIKGPYNLIIKAARPDKRKRDLDNLLKPISDLLQSLGVIENDYLCQSIAAEWAVMGDGVYVRVEATSAIAGEQ